MHISLPVHHKIRTRLKHHRSHQTITVYKNADFILEEISASDAPIVIQGFDRNNTPIERYQKSPYGSGNHTVTDNRDEPNPTGILRYHDGSFWYPEYNANNQIATPNDWSPLREKNISRHDIEHHFWISLSAKAEERSFATSYDRETELDPDEHRNIEFSDFEETRAFYAQVLSDDIRVIDGQIYHRSPEPFYVVHQTYQRLKPVLQFSPFSKIKGEKVEFYRLDRYDEMIDRLNEAKDVFPEFMQNRKIEPGSKPVVMIEGILNFKDDEATIYRSAKKGLDGIESQVTGLPKEVAMYWYDLRDAISIAKNDKSDVNIELVADAYSKFCNVLSNMGNDEDRHYSTTDFIENANFALSRWEMRVIKVDIAFEF
jgi:hypothetical protein